MRASEALDLSRDLAAGVRDCYQAKVADDENEVMTRLTIVASRLISGVTDRRFDGMNVDGVPGYRWAFGHEYVLGLILLLTVAQLAWFKGTSWI